MYAFSTISINASKIVDFSGRNFPFIYTLKNMDSFSNISVNSSMIVDTDESTGLLRAKPGSSMLLADGSTLNVPENNFIHTQTAHVLPIQGNVAFDPVRSRLVMVVDSVSGNTHFPTTPWCSLSLTFH